MSNVPEFGVYKGMLKSYEESKMNKTLYLHLEPHDISPESGATVELELDELGILASAWSLDSRIASTYKTYDELGIELKEIKDERI